MSVKYTKHDVSCYLEIIINYDCDFKIVFINNRDVYLSFVVNR